MKSTEKSGPFYATRVKNRGLELTADITINKGDQMWSPSLSDRPLRRPS